MHLHPATEAIALIGFVFGRRAAQIASGVVLAAMVLFGVAVVALSVIDACR